ncbi:MAG TPA: hypothetical protein VFB21_10765 [Chthonomonadaceae bacterium]|nr:hypothetical protein [Chthonomonadaceae bacterium]
MTYGPPETVPAWAQDIVPTDSVPIDGNGPSSADAVNLATGAEEHTPDPDIVVRNPNGPKVVYARQYRSTLASVGMYAPGLSPGWTDNYNVYLDRTTPYTTGTWGKYLLTYPNSARELLTPVLDASGNPTGQLTAPSGAPYAASGSPKQGQPGQWNSFTLTFKDGSTWTFVPSSTANRYYLYQIADLLYPNNTAYHTIRLIRDTNAANNNRIDHIEDAAGNVLLRFSYLNGYLSALMDVAASNDADKRQVNYTFGTTPTTAGVTCLLEVDQIAPYLGSASARWIYDYKAAPNGQPLLNFVKVPDPNQGSSPPSHPINYDEAARVSSLVDARGNQRVYSYSSGATKVEIKKSSGQIVESW